ncbi:MULTISPECIES: hypothetical protein [unclassified Thioalkalivibrio]|uniref:hypothetical protein n=1 Tax=unclassified Thioalkalivibrio TaxID=2621013 RepID=UPI0003720C04|nr:MULTISPECIES: hypothetical protein [unclassified Thioalkalivibrio]
MNRRSFLATAVASAAAAGLSACATLERMGGGARAAVQYATLRYLGDDSLRAERARHVLVEIRPVATGETTLEALAQAVEDAIPWDDLDLADATLLAELLGALRAELESRIGDGLLDPDDVERVERVIDWIDDAAARVESRG